LAAVTARLVAELPDVVVERARRAAVDIDADALPRLVVLGDGVQADASQEYSVTHYQIAFSVTGFVRSTSDVLVEQGLSTLYARVVDALVRWTPTTPGLADPFENETDFTLFDADESAIPAGNFCARFVLTAVSPTGGPWST